MADFPAAKAVPLTCHGHSRPITHISFTSTIENDEYFLVSASKDNTPQLRNGATGDWVGTFLGHKGAVWSAGVADTGSVVVTGSADFSAKVWDATTGDTLVTLPHNHIVRAVELAPGPDPALVATGGSEKILRVWDLKDSGSAQDSGTVPNYEIGKGVHGGTIKSIVWTSESNLLVSGGDDKMIRWWDMRQDKPTSTFEVDGVFGSLEGTTQAHDQVLAVASGKKVYFFTHSGRLLKTHTMPKDVSSVAINWEERKFVTGSSQDTWVRIYDYDSGEELAICKGHHGPVWTTAFSPDGKMFATGSEDGTIKLWKFVEGPYGQWKGSADVPTAVVANVAIE